MNTGFYAAGSALLSHQIVEQLKEKGYLKNKMVILLSSFLCNFALAIGWAIFDGNPLSQSLFYGVAQAVASSLYHDFKTMV